MKNPFRSYSKPVQCLGTALLLSAGLSMYASLSMPAATAAGGLTVPVAQQPLTLQPTIPPDVVLMLDDSGSMKADYMPDYEYIQYQSNDAMIDAANNGLYYNPTVTYTPPPYANGTLYPNETDITQVPEDGITGANGNVNLTNYNSIYECDHSQNCHFESDGKPYGHIYFSALATNAPSVTYSQSGISNKACNALYASYLGASSGGSSFTGGICSFTYTPGYFQYAMGPASSPTVYYVAPASQGCGSQSNCVVDTDTTGAAAPKGIPAGENIANWFAYYHTRILMAKSGVMTAFTNLDPSFRVGFGSINGNNAAFISGLPNAYSFATSTNANNNLAGVAPFGKSSDPSSTSGISRYNFWSWIANESAGGNTPLRQALDAVGKYYSGTDSSSPASNAWDTMSSDPNYSPTGSNDTQLACRQAYTILTTDGFWNSDYSGVGNADGTAGTQVTGPNGQSYTYSPVAPYADSYSDTLADVAMHYWETDLQPTLPNEVPPSTEDPAFWQHMVTFTMGLGFTPTGITGTAPSGGNPTTQDIFNWANDGGGSASKYAITNFAWPQPAGNSINNIADLEHAGVDGHGGFFSATNPQTFVNGIEAALKRATERVGTGASLAANSTQLTTGTVIYQANYYTSTWTGDLKAYSVNAVTGAIAATPKWQASKSMPAASTRNVMTWNGTKFVAFENGTGTPPDLSTLQLAALDSPTLLGSGASAEESMVNYLRGDQTQEQQNGGVLRTRGWTLGDVVDSQPVYSGPPDSREYVGQSFYGTTADSTGTIPFYNWAVGTTDAAGTFTASAASQRTPLIFVAANDGMLHAFNAATGSEVFAYLPGAVITAGVAGLANPAYGSAADPHQYYNDGQLTIADAYVTLKQEGESTPSWHTILVGTTGRGLAEAVYAIDITDPNNITPLWERSAGDGLPGSTYIGQMVGKPVIAQTNSAPASSPTSSTWSVLIGNGYNSAAGVAALLQFNLATGALSVHATDNQTANGLAAPVAWMDNAGDGVSDVAYAGDLLGRVWSFQLNDTTGANPTPTSTGTLLFTAKDASGTPQPITAGMLAGRDPETNNVWLFFGTGRYLSNADLTNTQTQTWYGIIVQSSTSKLVSNLSNGRSALVQRTITAQTAGGSGSLPARTVSTQTVNSTNGTTDMSGKSGWYLDLLAPIGTSGGPVQQGERMVDSNEFQGSLLIGITRIPQVTDICNPSGSGWIMALNPFTGAAPANNFFDTNGDGYVNGGDEVGGKPAAGVGFSSLPNAPIFVGGTMETSFDNGTTSSMKTAGTVGVTQRTSWRELVNP